MRTKCVCSFHDISYLDQSSLRSIFQDQITNLILINDDDHIKDHGSIYTSKIYAHILNFFKNLKVLNIIETSVMSYPALSLCYLPSNTFSSSILTELHINVETFNDCLYLLDGRLKQLTRLSVTVDHVPKSISIINSMVSLEK
jgi:hypothetical protein